MTHGEIVQLNDTAQNAVQRYYESLLGYEAMIAHAARVIGHDRLFIFDEIRRLHPELQDWDFKIAYGSKTAIVTKPRAALEDEAS